MAKGKLVNLTEAHKRQVQQALRDGGERCKLCGSSDFTIYGVVAADADSIDIAYNCQQGHGTTRGVAMNLRDGVLVPASP